MIWNRNKGEKAFSHLLYHFLKFVTVLSLRVYHSRTTIVNRKYLNSTRPTILVANHPNMLLDPLNVVSRVNKTVHFFANASLMNGRMGWLFRRLYCIPVERPQDVAGGKINNEAGFSACHEVLAGGGCLFIAPQGGSALTRQLGKLKTGTSRIALDTESQCDFKLGLQLIPVGIVYSAPMQFRSAVFIHVGAPIEVCDYRSDYQKDRFEAVRRLTDHLRQQLSKLTIDTNSKADDELLKEIEILHESEKPLTPINTFFRSKKLYQRLAEIQADQSALFSTLKLKIDAYFNQLKQYKCSDKAIASYRNTKSFLNVVLQIIYLILGFPFFLFGMAGNFLPCFFPAILARNLNIDPGYSSTVKILAGLFSFPLFYGLQISLVHHLFNEFYISLIYALSLLPSGWFAWTYKAFAQKQLELFTLGISRSQQAEVLKKHRNEILDDLFDLNLLLPA